MRAIAVTDADFRQLVALPHELPGVEFKPPGQIAARSDMGHRIRAERDMPVLNVFTDRLLQFVREMFRAPLHYDDVNDHLAFMALCYVSKEAEHLQSVRALVTATNYRDALLMARSMIEGLSLLVWAARKSPDRALLWRAFVWIEEWRLMQEKERAGETVDPRKKADIEHQRQNYGHLFLTKKARASQEKSLSMPPDPYWAHWHEGKAIATIFQEVQAGQLYKHIYRETSEWTHWSSRGLGMAIRREADHVQYTLESLDYAATALAAGFQALLETSMLLDAHVTLGFKSRLSQLRDEYIHQRTGP